MKALPNALPKVLIKAHITPNTTARCSELLCFYNEASEGYGEREKPGVFEKSTTLQAPEEYEGSEKFQYLAAPVLFPFLIRQQLVIICEYRYRLAAIEQLARTEECDVEGLRRNMMSLQLVSRAFR